MMGFGLGGMVGSSPAVSFSTFSLGTAAVGFAVGGGTFPGDEGLLACGCGVGDDDGLRVGLGVGCFVGLLEVICSSDTGDLV